MNTSTKLFAALLFGLVGTFAQAQQPSPGMGNEPAAAPAGKAAKPSYDQFDTDHDGRISRQEAAASPTLSASFDQIDTNRDGYLSKQELSAWKKAQHAMRKGNMKALDKDGDGKISREEAAANPKLAKRFDMIDTNHDGFLSAEELAAYKASKRGAKPTN
jgi:Ca2+-binding EF-hand superfamily protein